MTLLEALLKNDVEEGQVVEAEVRLGQGLYWERATEARGLATNRRHSCQRESGSASVPGE